MSEAIQAALVGYAGHRGTQSTVLPEVIRLVWQIELAKDAWSQA